MCEEEAAVPSVSQVVRDADRFEGAAMTVRGLLVVPATGVYLVDLVAQPGQSIVPAWETADRLLIDQPGLADQLLARIPAYGGGPFMYRDPAVVRATVRRSGDSLVLTDLRELTITQSGVEYHVDDLS